jgi:hypothetical protein
MFEMTVENILPYILSIIMIVVINAAGNLKRWSWMLGIVCQGLWVWWIVVVEAWGLLLLTAAMLYVYGRNWMKWKGMKDGSQVD